MQFQNAASASTPVANPTLNGEITTNEKRIEELHQRISQLENRLSPILRAVPPQPQGTSPTEPPMPWSAVVCALRQSGFQIEAAAARIDDLISRLDV